VAKNIAPAPVPVVNDAVGEYHSSGCGPTHRWAQCVMMLAEMANQEHLNILAKGVEA
jgi:hypothetical protein